MKKIAFENEIIVVDQNWIPQNYIDSEITSEKIIEIVRRKIPEVIVFWWISKELDACQIELRNMWPKNSLMEAQDELLYLFDIIEDVIRNDFWLLISQNVVPKQDYIPMHSWLERYKTIQWALMQLGIEYWRSTNIAWLHLNVDSNLEDHFIINNWIELLFRNKDIQKMWISKERLQMYLMAVSWVNNWLWMTLSSVPKNYSSVKQMKWEILDSEGNPLFDYWFTRLKKYWSTYVSEVRTSDGWVNQDDILIKTNNIYQLIESIKSEITCLI